MSRDYKVPKIFENPLAIIDTAEYLLKPLILNIRPGSEQDDLSKKDKSWIFGTPVITTIEMTGSNKVDLLTYNNKYDNTPVSLKLDNLLLTITNNKSVIKNDIVGRNGDVSSTISIQSIDIQIQGRIDKSYNQNANEEGVKLNNFLRQPRPIAVSCKELQDLNIMYIIVKSFDISQSEGVYSTQFYTINAVKYEPNRNRFIIKEQL